MISTSLLRKRAIFKGVYIFEKSFFKGMSYIYREWSIYSNREGIWHIIKKSINDFLYMISISLFFVADLQ